MAVFVTYVARCGQRGKLPLLELEANGQLLPSDRPGKAVPVTLTALAVEEEFWAPLNHGMAHFGRMEFVPDDDSDNCLFWLISGNIIQIRAFGSIIQLDVSHINQPLDPSTLEIGGEA
jgi:hypothetical protein